jgi:ankyrin repeat protein
VASLFGYVNVVWSLLEDPRVDPTARNNEAIRMASENGHIEVVELLLENNRVDPTTAIFNASKNGHIDVIQLLLENGVNPANDNNKAIRWASENGHVDVVELLLQDRRVFLTGLSIRGYTVFQKTMFDRSSESGKVLAVLYMMYHDVLRRIPGNERRIEVTKKYIQGLVEELVEEGPKQLPISMILSYRIKNLPMLYFLHDKIELQWGDRSDGINPDGTYIIYLNDLSEEGIEDLLGRMRELCLEDEISKI